MIPTAIILAGGLGTRLRSVVKDIPKSMAPVNGRPFIDFLLAQLQQQGFDHCVISTGYLGETIRSHVGTTFQNMQIQYVNEENPLGTGGGIRLAMQKVAGELALVLNGDTMFNIDFKKFIADHTETKATHSLALRHVSDAARYGTVVLDDTHRITSFREKDGQSRPGLINGGTYLLNKAHYLNNTGSSPFSIEKDFFEVQHQQTRICGFPYDKYFIDIGIPEDYQRAQHELEKLTH